MFDEQGCDGSVLLDKTDTIDTEKEALANIFDNKFFANIHKGRGIVQSDQVLYSTPNADTIPIVSKFLANETDFFESFAVAMIKLGNISCFNL